jgi:hypothetical protein
MIEAVGRCARWCLFGFAVLVSGCANLGAVFTVETSSSDPLIYVPGTAPAKTLHVPLESVSLTCDRAIVEVPSLETTFVVTTRLWQVSTGLKAVAVASIGANDAAKLAKAPSSHDELLKAFQNHVKPSGCGLKPAQPDAAVGEAVSTAAAQIRWHLPIPFSAMLRDAYNHQVWPKPVADEQDITAWISLDLQPGMRLRVENSLPISPRGINSTDTHPSSFAAPTYVYFHSLTGAELCGSGARVPKSDTTAPNDGAPKESFHCHQTTAPLLTDVFVSASSGLARLGLFQHPEAVNAPQRAQPSSGLIDLQERYSEGEGAWRHWRLWLPAGRRTDPNRSITSGGVGAKEAVNSAPLLMMASSLHELGDLRPDVSSPCESTQPVTWSCRSLHFRAVPIPEIAITVKGTLTWVPVGTTLRELLEHRWHKPYVREKHVGAQGRHLAAQRRVLTEVELNRRHQGALHPVVPSSLEGDDQVRAFLRIQLMPGDEIRWP